MELVKLEYKVDQNQVLTTKPLTLCTMTFPNRTSIEQSHTFEDTRAFDHTSQFEWNAGFEIKYGAEVKAGIPAVAEGKISSEHKTSIGRKWGEVEKESRTYKFSIPVKVKAGTQVKCHAKITSAELRVPFVATWRSKETNTEVQTEGTWNGVSTWDFRTEMTEEPLP
jgi:hypothetical protein